MRGGLIWTLGLALIAADLALTSQGRKLWALFTQPAEPAPGPNPADPNAAARYFLGLAAGSAAAGQAAGQALAGQESPLQSEESAAALLWQRLHGVR